MSNSKNLHKHSLPIVVLSCALFMLSIAGYKSFASVNGFTSLRQALFVHTLNVKPASNGFAHISVNQQLLNKDTARSYQPQSSSTMQNIAALSGESAQLSTQATTAN